MKEDGAAGNQGTVTENEIEVLGAFSLLLSSCEGLQ